MPPAFRENDGPVHVLVEPLLEYAAAQVIGLAARITSSMASHSSVSLMWAFLAAFENQAVLNTRSAFEAGVATPRM
jgi:hypothetical protein